MSARTLGVACVVAITVSDDAPSDWLTRVTVPNEFPYWNNDGSPFTEEQGLHMLADNAVRNGVDDASELDGWADLERGMVRLDVSNVVVES
ncbi:MAG TPA: hypothetical protein VJL80_06290 [Aeromicrobium sp.]|nr:hypothetical protein [Aeromicrobium sp.]HKY57628.1 hypothetical protein [Aeromicrobium sp.]